MTPSGLVRSKMSSSSAKTRRTSGPFSGLWTAPKARAVMRLSISGRTLVVSISSWMEMSEVENGIVLNGLYAVTPNSVPRGGQRARGTCCPIPWINHPNHS